MVSVFERGWFRRKRSAADDRPRRSSAYEDPDPDDEEALDEDLQTAPARPGPFWALKDVAFRVPRGAALGVLGGPDSGKSTLLRILGGRSFPTEGRVLVRGQVSPLPAALASALRLSDRGPYDFDLVHASRLFGLEAHLVKQHRTRSRSWLSPCRAPMASRRPGGRRGSLSPRQSLSPRASFCSRR